MKVSDKELIKIGNRLGKRKATDLIILGTDHSGTNMVAYNYINKILRIKNAGETSR